MDSYIVVISYDLGASANTSPRRAFSPTAGTKLGEITGISEDAGGLVIELRLNDDGLRVLRDSDYAPGIWDDEDD